MAAIESLSSCGPQPNCQPPPPRAQAPKPTGVMFIFEFPSLRICMTSPEYLVVGLHQVRCRWQEKVKHSCLGLGGQPKKAVPLIGAHLGVRKDVGSWGKRRAQRAELLTEVELAICWVIFSSWIGFGGYAPQRRR